VRALPWLTRELRALFSLVACSLFLVPSSFTAPINGIWLNRHLMGEGEEAITAFLEDCQARGITHVLPNFWFHGAVIYPDSELAPQHADFVGWDPMAAVVREAHARGLKVWPWSEYGLFAHFNRTHDEADPGWILEAHPDWRIQNREGHTGLRNDGIGATHFSMNPAHPDARRFLVELHMELAGRYAIDGINTDRFRYMSPDWGFDAYSQAQFASDERVDHAAPEAFDRWRALVINDLVSEFAAQWRPAHPDLPITAAVNPPHMFREKFQLFDEWMEGGWLDVAVPMIYGGPDLVRRESEAVEEMLPENAEWLAGLDYGQGDAVFAELVRIARDAGAAGVVVWNDTAWREGSHSFRE
jgi:uncharacterized lipoprotein YddW (UPF0748 family)